MYRAALFLFVSLTACNNSGSSVKQRTGDSDVKISDEILKCVFQSDTQTVMDFLATQSGSEDEDHEMRKLMKSISKNCTDNAIVHGDVVDLRYRLKPMLN
jgi:hypothetical protein